MRVSKIVYLGFITRLKAYIQREQLINGLFPDMAQVMAIKAILDGVSVKTGQPAV